MTLYDIEVRSIDGTPVRLDAYRGRTLLIVNVASRCGYTPQYTGLERLFRKYKDRGFAILGFPCNQFGRQEPGSEAEIHGFCRETYDITFPLFAKIEVNGSNTHPLYRFLKSAKKGLFGSATIKWNFTKFLVDAEGRVLKRYAPAVTPESIDPDVARILDGTAAG